MNGSLIIPEASGNGEKDPDCTCYEDGDHRLIFEGCPVHRLCRICGLPEWQCDGTGWKHWTRADEEASLAVADYAEGILRGDA